MRVYELAKKMNASSLEVIKQAKALDIEADSPLITLAADEVTRIQEQFQKRTAEETERTVSERVAKLKEKQDKVTVRRTKSFQTEKSVLETNRRRALEMNAHAKGTSLSLPPMEPVSKKVETPEVPVSVPEVKVEKGASVADAVAPETVAAAQTSELAQKPATVEKAQDAGSEKKGVDAHLPKAHAKPRTVHYEKEELEPEEELAVPFIGRNNVTVTREVPKPTRALNQKDKGGGRDVEVRRQPLSRSTQQGNASQRPAPWQQQRPGVSAPTAPAAAQDGIAADRIITVRGAMMVKELAEYLGLRPNRLIADLMQLNILASINQRVDVDVAQRIADKYGYKIEIERQKRSTERKPILRSEDADDAIPEDKPEEMQIRPPVVTFLGHVDHGKTSLMDRIRNTRVASGEAGGITQHIGAYTVEINGRKITFLDTPGHAAFSAMRARGASLTDIAVIIIAADDGIMPQTREVIKQAQQAGVQILVALNKCDLPTAKPDRVRQMLQAEGLTPEEWGGDVICTEVSAITGAGVNHLLEMILLQADMLELTANPSRRADGFVVEAQLEQGLGPTATLLVSGGTLNVGDIILCGEFFGRIRGLIDDRGRRVKSAGPTTAVKCMGLSGVPEAGAPFRVMLNEKRARELAERSGEERKQSVLVNAKATSLDALMTQMKDSLRRELAVIVKADTQGSSEAIVEALREIKSEKVSLNIVTEGIGNISATDVNKAAAGHALVIGFSVACETGVQQQARHVGVRVSTFRIIYELIDFVKQRMLDLLPPEYKEVVKGHAEIRAVFDIGKMGRVAGCQMQDGVLRADSRFRVFRKKEKVWDGKLSSLKHFQNEVSEVTGSQECGVFFNGFEEFQVGDTIECYALEELPRAL